MDILENLLPPSGLEKKAPRGGKKNNFPRPGEGGGKRDLVSDIYLNFTEMGGRCIVLLSTAG